MTSLLILCALAVLLVCAITAYACVVVGSRADRLEERRVGGDRMLGADMAPRDLLYPP